MKGFALWTTIAAVGAAIAMFNLVTGWTVNIGLGADAILVAIFGLTVALYVLMVKTALQDRRALRAAPIESAVLAKRATRSLRWCGAFALIAAVLLFTNCSGLITPVGQPVAATNVTADPGSFLTQSALLLLPFLVVLVLAPVVISRYKRLALWSLFLLAGAAPVSFVVGFYATAITCGELGPLTLGACAASGGSLTEVLSAAAMLLYVPYVAMIGSALRDAR